MAEWYAAKELSGLPGLPGTDRAVQMRASREGWQAQENSCRGGKRREYHISSLPQETREALLEQTIERIATPESMPATCTAGSAVSVPVVGSTALPATLTNHDTTGLKKWQRDILEARLAILHQVDLLAKTFGVNRAVDKVVTLANHGTLPPQIQQMVERANARGTSLSVATVKRWRGQRKQGDVALAPRETTSVAAHTPKWAEALLKAYRKPQKTPLTEAVKEVRELGYQITYQNARRYLQRVGAVEVNRGRMSPRELKNIKPFRRRDTSMLLPNDIATADGHTYDAEVAHPFHGRPFRPEITLILDVATRAATGWSIGLAESALEVLSALRCAVEGFGVPAMFYVDNGSGYKNALMTAQGTGMTGRLGITTTHSLPRNSQARGIIERAHKTILINSARKLPTFVGKDMDSEVKQLMHKRVRSDKTRDKYLIGWEEFRQFIAATVHEYNHRPHRGLSKIVDDVTGRKRHMSPAEAWKAHAANGWEPVPAGELDDLYMPQAKRTVKRGEIQLWSNRYFSTDLTEWHDEEVIVGYKIDDPAKIWVRDLDQRLICVAELDGNKSPYYPLSYIEQAREKRADGRRKRLDRKYEEIEQERTGGLPQPVYEEAVLEEHREAVVVQLGTVKEPNPVQMNESERYYHWVDLEEKIAAGELVSEGALRFHEAFQKTDTWRVFKKMEEDLTINQ